MTDVVFVVAGRLVRFVQPWVDSHEPVYPLTQSLTVVPFFYSHLSLMGTIPIDVSSAKTANTKALEPFSDG